MQTHFIEGDAKRNIKFRLISEKSRPRIVSRGMNARQRMKKKFHTVNCAQAIEDSCSEKLEFPHVLIDYRNDNEKIKFKMLNLLEAWQKNQVLRGTGFAWAKTGSMK